MLGLSSAEGAAVAVCESRATEVSAAVARAGVRRPATRVPAGRGFRCGAMKGVSFRLPPTELAVGFGRVVPEGLPYGPCPGGQLDRFTPRSVGPRLRLPLLAHRTRRRPRGPATFAGGGRAACPHASQL